MTSGGSTIYTETFGYNDWDRVGQRSWTRDGRTYTMSITLTLRSKTFLEGGQRLTGQIVTRSFDNGCKDKD
jgi:hypothetical protein